jgi:hypothetical protein
MKKILLSVSSLALASGLFAQVPKFCLLEEFTQASCPPCAAQNPGFESSILTPNPVKVHHISFHTSWPGTDPMYNTNTGGSAARVTFYGVTGVPDVFVNGNVKHTSPSGVTQSDVDNSWAAGSAVKVVVTEVDNGTNRDVTVKVTTVSTPPSGTYMLYVAAIQRMATYTTAPGTNGEKTFPNVFRQMVSGNPQTLPAGNANGVAITLPTVGNSVTFGPYNYLETVAINGATTQLASLAWIQNTSTKEVIQSGASFDPPMNGLMSMPSAVVVNAAASSPQTFTFNTSNSGSSAESFSYTLTNNAPANWTGSFTINSTPYTSTTTLSVPAGTTYPVTINVTPGATPAVGKYTLTMQSITNPSSPSNITSVYVISGVTDLVVSNSSGQGDNTGTGLQYEPDYVAGLVFANCATYGATDDATLLRAFTDNAMGQIKYIYWNVGWTFPAFINDNLAAQLTTFLNGGGCLFVAGQDFGWDVWTASASGGHGTPAQQTFYTNFLGAAFVDDGVATTTAIGANTSDAIFGSAGASIPLSTTVYTGTSFFPDDINAAGTGAVIFKYSSNSKTAGVRNTNGTFKTVYLAPGIEQMTTAANKNTVLKITYDWFHLATGTQDLDNAMLALSMGQNFPNPAVDFTYIPFSDLKTDVTLQVMDMTGRILSQNKVEKGTGVFKLNTSKLSSGMYMYRITDGTIAGSAKPLQVIR